MKYLFAKIVKSNITLLFITLFAHTAFCQEVVEAKYKIKNLGTITLPGNLEVQSGKYRKFMDDEFQDYGFSYEVLENKVVFQQKGLNIGQNSNTYVRVILNTHIGNTGDYPIKEVTNYELEMIEKETYKMFEGTEYQLINFIGVENILLNEKYLAVKTCYIRKYRDNPNVYVESYIIMNNDRMHTISISYQVKNEEIWSPKFKNAISTLLLNNYN